jgi:hypothetical protein
VRSQRRREEIGSTSEETTNPIECRGRRVARLRNGGMRTVAMNASAPHLECNIKMEAGEPAPVALKGLNSSEFSI